MLSYDAEFPVSSVLIENAPRMPRFSVKEGSVDAPHLESEFSGGSVTSSENLENQSASIGAGESLDIEMEPSPDCNCIDSWHGVSYSPQCMVLNSESDEFDRWTKEDDMPICYQCDACKNRNHQLSREDARKLKIYRDCLTYDEVKKCFYTKMPWIKTFSNIPDNRSQALKRLRSLTSSMAKSEEMRQRYIAEFEKAIQEGVLVEISPEEDAEWKSCGGKVWHVDHFAVINESSESTPLRVVTDPTSSYKGIVINDLWEAPPNLTPPIDGLILAFRSKPVPISMDIKRAYRTLFLEQEESHFHRLLWNKLDPSGEVKTFRMTKNNWGLRPAGALCSVAMLILVERFRDQYPHVYEFVKNQIYVDDGTYSVDSVEDAMKLARDTCRVMSEGSFRVKYFIIGGKDIDISQENREDFELPDQVRKGSAFERVLGLNWFPETDEISVKCRINFSRKKRGARTQPDVPFDKYEEMFPEVFTLKMYLSIIASLYDVCGLTSPASITLRHELGRIFASGVNWNDALPEGQHGDTTPSRYRCKELIRVLYGIGDIRIPRCLQPEYFVSGTKPILVLFADSSQTAYGCVAYINWKTSEQCRVSRLALAKAKPFPKRPPLMTIPRGELMGAVLAVRAKERILKYTPFEFERIIFITDSTIVLGQICQDPYRFKQWTAARVEEVQTYSKAEEWYHVESKLNVADACTRGLDTSELKRDSVWQNAPEFMATPVEEWPIRSSSNFAAVRTGESEMRIKDPRMKICKSAFEQGNECCVDNLLIDSSEKLTSKDSAIMDYLLTCDVGGIKPRDTWMGLRKRIARVIRFAESIGEKYKTLKCKLPVVKTRNAKREIRDRVSEFVILSPRQRSEYISLNDQFVPTKRELGLAKNFWIINAQKDISDKFVRENMKLNPVFCNDGLWRSYGRTHSAQHTPLVIPQGAKLAEILLKSYHKPAHHGPDTTLAKVGEHFWIVKGRILVNELTAKCVYCRRLRKKPVEVSMAPLRIERLTRSNAFQFVSLDLAGPYMTKHERRSSRANPALDGKVWVVVYVCQSTGAVHLELTESYETNDFLAALDNFVHIRGKPEKISADLGSQIVGAAGVLTNFWTKMDKSKIMNFDSEHIEWDFVPSGNHSALGLAERMVRSFKSTMEAVTCTRKPELKKLEFSRMLYSVADLMNDRPLAVGRTKIDKMDADRLIRPNDLLLGRATSDVTSLIPSLADVNLRGKSKYIGILQRNEAFVNAFWTKWRTVVFESLKATEKWFKTGRALKKGDVVLIKDSNTIRNKWSLGEIHQVHESGVDGLIRKAIVRYKEPVADNSRKRQSVYVPSKSKFVMKSARDLVVLLTVDERDLDDNV